jgi:hypothetical protein
MQLEATGKQLIMTKRYNIEYGMLWFCFLLTYNPVQKYFKDC